MNDRLQKKPYCELPMEHNILNMYHSCVGNSSDCVGLHTRVVKSHHRIPLPFLYEARYESVNMKSTETPTSLYLWRGLAMTSEQIQSMLVTNVKACTPEILPKRLCITAPSNGP